MHRLVSIHAQLLWIRTHGKRLKDRFGVSTKHRPACVTNVRYVLLIKMHAQCLHFSSFVFNMLHVLFFQWHWKKVFCLINTVTSIASRTVNRCQLNADLGNPVDSDAAQFMLMWLFCSGCPMNCWWTCSIFARSQLTLLPVNAVNCKSIQIRIVFHYYLS